MKSSCILFVLTLILCSCQDVVETDIVEIEQTIYILGLISPENDSLRVNISRTVPALAFELNLEDPEPDVERFIVRNAEVTI